MPALPSHLDTEVGQEQWMDAFAAFGHTISVVRATQGHSAEIEGGAVTGWTPRDALDGTL